MVTIPNTFQAQTPIGQSLANLGTAIFGNTLSPSEREKQKLENQFLRSKIASNEADVRAANFGLAARQDIGDLIGRTMAARGNLTASAPVVDPGVGGSARALAATAAADETGQIRGAARQTVDEFIPSFALQLGRLVETPGQGLEALLGAAANVPGLTDEAGLVRARSGTGAALGVNQALTLGGQERVRAANLAANIERDRAKLAATPQSLSQAQAGAFGRLSPEAQEARVAGTGVPTVQVLDENGDPRNVPRTVASNPNRTVPLSAFPRAVPRGATTQAGLGLEKSTRASLEKSEFAIQDFNSFVDVTLDIAKTDPSLFGAVGNVKRLAQSAAGQANALGSALNLGSFEDAAIELQKAKVAPEFFDPNLSGIEQMATLTAFQAASALAQQTGRALSDKDFTVFRRIVGNPTDWLSTQEEFVSRLERLRTLANKMARDRQRALRGGEPEQAAPEGPEGPADVQGMTDEELLRELQK
jgi:hypothetical protein